MTPARLGALAVMLATLTAITAGSPGLRARPSGAPEALLVLVDDVSFEELLAIPEVGALARSGGAGLLANGEDVAVLGTPERAIHLDPGTVADPGRAGRIIREAVLAATADDLLVIVVGGRSPAAVAVGDELWGIVVARGAPAELLADGGRARTVTSDSTRRPGVVTGGDVRATLDPGGGGGGPAAGEVAAGGPIRVLDGAPPFELHERYLAQRRMYVPIGAAAALSVTGVGLVAIALLAVRRRVPREWRRAAGWACLSVPMLATGMLAAGHLTLLSYATAVPMIAIFAVFGTLAFSPLERRDLTWVPAGIGAAVLGLFVVEAVLGWSGMLTPLLGGSELDGGRFYGMPNVAIGLLVGSGLWVAQRLSTVRGFLLLCALGLFAGLPLVGANLGGAVTAFAAAGTWVAVRERTRLGVVKGLAVVAGVTAAGAGLVLLAHAISPVATHVTRFEESVGGLDGLVDRFTDRFRVGLDLIAGSPAALVPVLGLPVVLAVVLRPPPSIRATFERWPPWRDAVLVTILAGIVASVVNDSGPAAAGLAFGLGLGGMLAVSLLGPEGEMMGT